MARPRISFGILDHIPPAVRTILLLNVLIWLLLNLTGSVGRYVELYLSISMPGMLGHFMLWQPLTYFFLHADFLHLLFNMLSFFLLGRELEEMWGTKRFVSFYMSAGVLSGLFIILWGLITVVAGAGWEWFSTMREIPGLGWGAFANAVSVRYDAATSTAAMGFTLGASGAILGLLMAYCLYFPDRTILVFFIIPMRMAHFIYLSFGLTFLFMIFPRISFFGANISHVAHLGGMLAGLAMVRLFRNQVVFRPANQTLESFFRAVGEKLGLKRRQVWMAPDAHNSPSLWQKFAGLFKKKPKAILDETRMGEKEIEARIDELLVIISRKGLKGLTIDEQLFLDRVARLYRHKFPN